MLPRWSASEERDNIMAWMHVMSPGPGNTYFILSARHKPWISSDNLTLYYSTLFTSTFATISTDIPSYKAIHGRIPLQWHRALQSCIHYEKNVQVGCYSFQFDLKQTMYSPWCLTSVRYHLSLLLHTSKSWLKEHLTNKLEDLTPPEQCVLHPRCHSMWCTNNSETS